MPRPRLPDQIKFCAACGKQLFRKRYGINLEDRTVFAKRKYCDQLCMAAGMMQDQPTLAALRKRAKGLVGQNCQECGTTEKLQVHHIDMNPANNEPSNIMTLCAACHASWHWKRGNHRELICLKPSPCGVCGKVSLKLWRGMCQKHYQRFKKYGDPLMTKQWNGSCFELVRETPSVKNDPPSPESQPESQNAQPA